MSSKSLFRWAAVALVVSGASLTVGMIVHPTPPFADAIAAGEWAVSHFFWWLGALAGIAGIAGLYLRQRSRVGLLGFAGSGFSILGLILIASAMYFEAFIAPSVATQAPELFQAYPTGGGWQGFLIGVLASGALFGVGFLLLGIGMLRAGVMARWAVLLAVVGGIPFAVNFLLPRPVAILAVVIFAIGLLGLGYGLWTSAPQPAAQPQASRARLSDQSA
jgi:hypothetical protein